MKSEGPYRTPAELENNNQQLLKKMEEEIAESGGFSILLPENLGPKNKLLRYHALNLDFPIFLNLLETKIDPKNPKKKISPQDISFYSLETGILKYSDVIPFAGGGQNYHYKNENDNKVSLEIVVDKDKATLVKIITREDAEKIKKETERDNWEFTVNMLENKIAELARIIKDGISPELKTDYLIKLSDLKTSLERLLFAIAGELEEKK